MVRIATDRAMSQQRKANWLETHNGIRDRLRPLAHEILSHARRKVQPGWKGILPNRNKDLIKSAFSPEPASTASAAYQDGFHRQRQREMSYRASLSSRRR